MSSEKVIHIRRKLEQRKGHRDLLATQLEEAHERKALAKKWLRRNEKAREIIKQVGLKTQEQLSYNISEVTTMALNAVLAKPYDLDLAFVERRNKTECDLTFSRDGNSTDPDFAGGGPRDVASFALRVASWSMQSPRSRNTLILDEPFKHLKGEETNAKMLDMLRQVSKKLGLQIIMVSDERVSRGVTIEATDKLIEVSIVKGVSKINVE